MRNRGMGLIFVALVIFMAGEIICLYTQRHIHKDIGHDIVYYNNNKKENLNIQQ